MDQSTLRKLPAELRNQIYELALQQSHGVTVELTCQRNEMLRSRSEYENAWTRRPLLQNSLSLTMTCKAIREESLGLFYSTNNFTLQLNLLNHDTAAALFEIADADHMADIMWRGSLRRWLASIGEKNHSCLRFVKLIIGFVSPDQSTTATTGDGLYQRSIGSLYLILDKPQIETQVAIELDFYRWITQHERERCYLSFPVKNATAAERAFESAVETRRQTVKTWLQHRRLSPAHLHSEEQDLVGYVHELKRHMYLTIDAVKLYQDPEVLARFPLTTLDWSAAAAAL